MAKALSHDTWRNTLRTASPRLPHPDLEHVLTWIGCCACYRNRTFSNPDVNTRQYLVCNISHFGLDYFSLYSTRYIQSILLQSFLTQSPNFSFLNILKNYSTFWVLCLAKDLLNSQCKNFLKWLWAIGKRKFSKEWWIFCLFVLCFKQNELSSAAV